MLINTKTGCIASGTATRDAEFKTVGDKGTALCKFSVAAMDKTDNAAAIFVNVIAWFELAKYAEQIQKGDKVLVCGTIKNADYTNKDGELVAKNELVADYISIQGKGTTEAKAEPPKKKQAKVEADFFAIDDSLDDEDLPF